MSDRCAKLPRAVIPVFMEVCRGWKRRDLQQRRFDIFGTFVAAALHADLYENWTDVSGIFDG